MELSTMAGFGPTSPFALGFIDDINWNFTDSIIFKVILSIVCFLGLLGNGQVIWILGFHMKTNSFSIYILNLAVADSGILILQVVSQISLTDDPDYFRIYFILNLIYFVLYNTSQLLLISISVDRCVSVLFPIWHRCHRPPKLSFTVCAITWVLPIVFFGLEMVALFTEHFLLLQLIFNGLICYPVMVLSTLILLVKIFCKQRQQKRKRVLTVSLLALICFTVFHLPLSILSIIAYTLLNDQYLKFGDLLVSLLLLKEDFIFEQLFILVFNFYPWLQHIFILELLSQICITVNSSINPILYFLAGRKKKDRSRVSMKLALHRLFRNEDSSKEDEMQPDETQL